MLVMLHYAAGTAGGQAVVPPMATYVETGADASSPGTARWHTDAGPVRTLRAAFDEPPSDHETYWEVARRALAVWSDVPDLPLRFEFVEETGLADVEFRWIERFPGAQAGSTHRRLGPDGFIERVTVVLARRHGDGTPMSDEFRLLVALHEVGHVLGLPHSEEPGDVMHPGNRNLVVSSRDVRSLRALYGALD